MLNQYYRFVTVTLFFKYSYWFSQILINSHILYSRKANLFIVIEIALWKISIRYSYFFVPYQQEINEKSKKVSSWREKLFPSLVHHLCANVCERLSFFAVHKSVNHVWCLTYVYRLSSTSLETVCLHCM